MLIQKDCVVFSTGVRAAFGLKRHFDVRESCAQTLQHQLNHVIGSDTQVAGADLRR
jgi:hypothetical protein